MARLHKISGYVVDIDESFCKHDLENALERMDMIVHHASVESVDIGEWYDEHPLNYTDCNLEECEKWFSNSNEDN